PRRLTAGRRVPRGLHERDSAAFTLLWETGYKVSRKKAQTRQEKVKYFGFHLSQGQCQLGPERKQDVFSIPALSTRHHVQEFVRSAGFCRIWIPNFSVLAKLLYEATDGEEWEPLLWESAQQKAFEEIKQALTNAPALGLPDMTKPFFLYFHKYTGIV
ncbi:pol protein, partial [Lynx pardinus]